MIGASRSLRRPTWLAARTSSPALACGVSLYGSPVGPTIFPCGPDHVHVNHSAEPARSEASPTSGISGQHGLRLLTSAGLQSSLENKLRARMDMLGSHMFVMISSARAMPSGAPIFCAASCGAPHARQRLYFAGVATDRRLELDPLRDRAARIVGHAGLYGDREHARELHGHESQHGIRRKNGDHPSIVASATSGYWKDADWLLCRDGRWRPVEPGTFPLEDGHPTRVEQLRAYGNAIVAPQAAIFIESVIEALLD